MAGVPVEVSPHRARARWHGLLQRTGWMERAGIVGLALITLITLLAPSLTPYDPLLRVGAGYLPPSAAHWFGTDEIGRDLFSRVIAGVRNTWLPGLAVIVFSLALGILVGLWSGTVGGRVDMLIQRVIDLFLVVPATLSALATIAALGPGLLNTMIALVATWWPWYARVCRDEIRRLIVRPHVEAARVAGARGPRLVFRYLLPGAMPTMIVMATLDVANVVMALSLMSFLGLGQPAPEPELGSMTARSLDSLTAFWWLPILPALAIFLLCLCANLAGDGLRTALRGR